MLDLRFLLVVSGTLATLAVGCDQNGDEGGANAALTTCKFSVAVTNENGKGYGESCTTSAECEYGACILPAGLGNITNTKFGFCTRACDCGNDVNAKIPADEKEQLECIYPITPNQHYRHVVIQCTSLAQCQAISPEWTACQNPGTGVSNVCTAL